MTSAFKTVHEIYTGADFNQGHSTLTEVNNHLNCGWVLIGVHKRGWDDFETERHTTVYILGHEQENAAHPPKQTWGEIK